MAEAADVYIYEETLDNSVPEKPFTDKIWTQIYDVNNGVYTNQIIFSTKQLVGNGKYADLANSYIEIPLVLAMQGGTNISAVGPNAFSVGLKNGSFQLVDYITLSYNGTSLAQQSNWSNLMIGYKINSSWSVDDLNKWGDKLMVAPDTSGVSYFNNGVVGASIFGDGVCNNVVADRTPQTDTWTTSPSGINSGYLRRLQNASFNGAAYNNLQVMTTNGAKTVAKNFFGNNGGANAAKIWYWSITATIRAKDLHDWFAKCPLLLSSQIDLIINLNTCNGTITYTNGANATTDCTMLTTSYNQTSGHCCPFMVSGAAVTGGASKYGQQPNGNLNNGTAGTPVLTVGCGINGCSSPSVGSVGALTNCRWYIPLYDMNPEYRKNMLESLMGEDGIPKRTIYYNDFYSFSTIKNVSGSFSQVLTSGVKNPKYLVMFPFYTAPAANSGNAFSNSPYQSFFDSAPGTVSPQISLTNLQVELGGKSLFTPFQQYDFQMFMDEFCSINALNGGKDPITTSGLITEKAWNDNQRIYVANLERRLYDDDGSSYSVQVSATVNSVNPVNQGSLNVDLICFVVYGRSMTVNMESGALLSLK